MRTVHDMPWDEFCSYLMGIMPETPLGQIVSIRSETNQDILKGFSKEQKRIRQEWLNQKAKRINKQTYDEVIENFKKMFESMAQGGDVNAN